MAVKPTFSLDEIIFELTTNWGERQLGPLRKWPGNTVTFSIPGIVPTVVYVYDEPQEPAGFRPPGTMALAAREAFSLWDDLIAVSLQELVGTPSQITIAYSTSTKGNGTYAGSYPTDDDADLFFFWQLGLPVEPPYPNGWFLDRSYIWLSGDNWDSLQPTALVDTTGNVIYGSGFRTIVHEIGHALGLDHGQDGMAKLPTASPPL